MGCVAAPRLYLTHRMRRPCSRFPTNRRQAASHSSVFAARRRYVEDVVAPPTNIEPLTNPVLPCATAMQAREYPVHEQHSRAQ
ncbi:hypothetical protein PviCFBP13515_02840 [Pseudomonas viridiflava]|nr:hypothetical protein PviCFBP13507_08990 [Pseudomonas viridiflava]TKK33090.1 hypothetical protein PviCFBP13515_02840 [Pseudomonas viridiflava]